MRLVWPSFKDDLPDQWSEHGCKKRKRWHLLTQSIEGALVEVVDMLQRLRELAVQSSNDTNSSTDRRYIEDEVALLKAEITRVSNNTRYNGTKVLDGTFTIAAAPDRN